LKTKKWDLVQSNFEDSDYSSKSCIYMGDSSGKLWSYERGFGLDKYTSIWSASKLISSLTIMRIVDAGFLKLNDTVGRHISWWTANDRKDITLAQLLSFRSGLYTKNKCTEWSGSEAKDTTIEACVKLAYQRGIQYTPGSTFVYDSIHMQVAAVMAMKATGLSDWHKIFNKYIGQVVGLSTLSVYDKPSSSNPVIAGGLTMSVNEYVKVLSAFFKGTLLSAKTTQAMFWEWGENKTLNVKIEYSPITNIASEVWYYSLGWWIECYNHGGLWSNTCFSNSPKVFSSTGAGGFYPYVDLVNNYYGVMGMNRVDEIIHKMIIIIIFSVIGFSCCVGIIVGLAIYFFQRHRRQSTYTKLSLS